jgi:hypothetical protein
MIIRNQPTGFYCRFDAQTPTCRRRKLQTWCKGKHFQGFCQIFSRLIADNHLNESIPAVVDIRLVPFVIVGCGRYEVRLLLVLLQPSAPARSLVELQLHKYTLKTARVLKKTAAVFEKSARVLKKRTLI